jgi:hypothetical protein
MGLTIKLYFSTKRCRADQVVKKTGPSRRSMPSSLGLSRTETCNPWRNPLARALGRNCLPTLTMAWSNTGWSRRLGSPS